MPHFYASAAFCSPLEVLTDGKRFFKAVDSLPCQRIRSSFGDSMQKKTIASISLFAIFLFFTGALFVFGRAFPSVIHVKAEKTAERYALPFDNSLCYRQTLNNCGPYSVAAVLNVVKGEKLSPELLAKKMPWRIRKNLTFPRGLVKLLRTHNVKTKEYVLKAKSTQEKIDWIKGVVSHDFPVIVLIKVNHVQHYLTVLGYDEAGFMLYDSIQEKNPENPRKTIADVNCTVGNRWYSYTDFIDLWDNGGYKIFFRNWALVCGTAADEKRDI